MASVNTIVDANFVEHGILRDNMTFGTPGRGEFGTYFNGYARGLWAIEQMLRRIFLGEPVGEYDLILDFSTAMTGARFFIPPMVVLGALAPE